MTYYDWLVRIVSAGRFHRDNYTKLLFALYSTEFYWTVKRDINRAKDGLDLREQYEIETGLYCDEAGSCTVLEMLIALAIRCENEIMYAYNSDLEDQTSRWFWMMVDNIGLGIYDDFCDFDSYEIDDILTRFMDRKYGSRFEFCPFPVENFVPGFEKMELVYQMNYYMKENFY